MKTRFYTLVIFTILLLQTTGYSQFWEYQISSTVQHLNGVFMVDQVNGWVCGDAGTLLKTNNGGQNWFQVAATGNDLNAVVFKDINTGIAVGDNGTIIRTTNAGTTWSPVTTGTTEQFRRVSWGTGSIVFAAGDNGLTAVSNDNGATWILRNAGTTERFRGAATAGLNKMWAAGDNGLIKYSSDSGINWVTQNTGITTADLHDVQFINETIGFAGGSSSNFIFTSNGGQTWLQRNAGIFFGLNGIYFKDANIGWGVSDAGTIFFTTNGGTSWTSQPCGSPNTLREAYFIHQGRGWTVGDNGTIVMYNNPNIPVELNSFTASVIDNSVNLTWSTASETNNLGFELQRQSVNESTEWMVIGFIQGKGNSTELNSYSYEDKNLLSGKYLYRIKQTDFDGSFAYHKLNAEVTIETPQNFSLEQNYPNPFNPATKIHYSISGDQYVSLKVYDAVGNEVAVLVNENKPAGKHEVTFSAQGGSASGGSAYSLSSGIYFYKLQAGSFIETKKMNLIK